MISIDAYLTAVHRGLGGMDPGVRKDILLEVRSHLTDSVGANGGNVGAAIQTLGDPESVARRYRELYGYSSSYRLLFTAVAGIVGAFTVPVLFVGQAGIFPFFVSAFFLSIEFIFLILVSTTAGIRVRLLPPGPVAIWRLPG